MVSDGPKTPTGESGADVPPNMAPTSERLYDAFVVRLWRESATGGLLRAEVEHIPTGERTHSTGRDLTWVFSQIQACLARRRPGNTESTSTDQSPADARGPPTAH